MIYKLFKKTHRNISKRGGLAWFMPQGSYVVNHPTETPCEHLSHLEKMSDSFVQKLKKTDFQRAENRTPATIFLIY